MEKELNLICVNCGKICGEIAVKGSMKHPYCKSCFKKVWSNDYAKYFIWLSKTH